MKVHAKNFRHLVFWPPFFMTSAGVLLSLFFGDAFVQRLNQWNMSALSILAPVFTYGGLVALLTCLVCCIAPLGKTVIGGRGAKPLLRLGDWLAISLCTTSAVGIFFWATAEPMFHLATPPASLGIAPSSRAAAIFAMSALYMHWSFVPCALYAVPALAFALVFYNRKLGFSLAYCLEPLIGKEYCERIAWLVDALALFALVSGMAASLATGIITLGGGLEFLYAIKSSVPLWIVLGLSIVFSFLASALSGLHKGIRILSNINTYMFFVMLGFFILFGPLSATAQLGVDGGAHFMQNFFSLTTLSAFAGDDPWPKQWTVFYLAVWAAWAPVTALFLGKIAYGYTVRMFVLVNLMVPAIFAVVWMFIIGGTAISFELDQGLGLKEVLKFKGAEGVAYAVFNALPYPQILIPFFLFSVFISYVTSADSNTIAMASMCTKNLDQTNPEPPAGIKFLWAGVLTCLALFMLCLGGLDGIRTLSYLGGFPAVAFEWFCMGSLWILIAESFVKSKETSKTMVKALETN